MILFRWCLHLLWEIYWRDFAAISFSTLCAFCHMYNFLSQICICCIQSVTESIYFCFWVDSPSLGGDTQRARSHRGRTRHCNRHRPWQINIKQRLKLKAESHNALLKFHSMPRDHQTKVFHQPDRKFLQHHPGSGSPLSPTIQQFCQQEVINTFINHLCSLGSLVFQGK